MEVDQAVYAIISDAVFKLGNENYNVFDKIFVWLGVIYIVICLLRTIYGRFKDTGLEVLFLSVSLGGIVWQIPWKVVIWNTALTCRNVCLK